MTTWDQQGVWYMRKRLADFHSGTHCVIGAAPNSYDEYNTEYPGKNDGSFTVNSWIICGEQGQQSGNEESCSEYRRVLSGTLNLVLPVADGSSIIESLSYPRDGVEVPPNCPRHWVLPEGTTMARGISILRELSGPPICPGSGSPLYAYYTWDTASPGFFDYIDCPRNRSQWKYQYIEVFHGILQFTRNNGDAVTDHCVQQGEAVFLRIDNDTEWDQRFSNGYGVTIFF